MQRTVGAVGAVGAVGIAASEVALAQRPEREKQTSPDISRHLTMLMMKSFGHRIPAPTGLAESW